MNARYLTALLLMLAAACFCLLRPERQQADAGPAAPRAVVPDRVAVAARTGEEDAAAIAEKRRQVNMQLAKLASAEMQREIDEADFATREPRYRELFSQWQISDAAADKALAIIKERELQQGAVFVQYLKAEDRPGSGKELTVSTDIEDALAEQELVRLLGENRHRELCLLDQTLDAERAARVRSQED